jgi:hypothetical protein
VSINAPAVSFAAVASHDIPSERVITLSDGFVSETLAAGLQQVGTREYQSAMGALVERALTKIKTKRAVSVLKDKAGFGINTINGQTVYVLPDTFEKRDDNFAGAAIIRLLLKQQKAFIMRPYTGAVVEISESSQDLASGILFGIGDDKNKLNLDVLESMFERGRRIVRGIQVKQLFQRHEEVMMKFLKRNNRYFGNNPNEAVLIGKTTIHPMQYAKGLGEIFIEDGLREILRTILIQLIKFDVLTDREVVRHAIASNMISFDEYMKLYCSRTKVVETAKGKRKARTEIKIPSIPNPSPLFRKDEQKFVRSLIAPYFALPPYTHSNEVFAKEIIEHGAKRVDDELQAIFTRRNELLVRYGVLTSTRLRRIRVTLLVAKKKKDITPEDVSSLFLKANPQELLPQELAIVDPEFKTILAKYRDKTETFLAGDAMKRLVKDWVADCDHRAPESINPDAFIIEEAERLVRSFEATLGQYKVKSYEYYNGLGKILESLLAYLTDPNAKPSRNAGLSSEAMNSLPSTFRSGLAEWVIRGDSRVREDLALAVSDVLSLSIDFEKAISLLREKGVEPPRPQKTDRPVHGYLQEPVRDAYPPLAASKASSKGSEASRRSRK